MACGYTRHWPCPEVVQRLDVTDVLLAIPSSTRQRRREIIESLHDLPVHPHLPGLSDPGQWACHGGRFQDLDIEGPGGPRTRGPLPSLLGQNLSGQVVMVTGAGGSGGSELCRQIVHEGPARLLLVDHSNLPSTASTTTDAAARKAPMAALEPLLASVGDARRMARYLSAPTAPAPSTMRRPTNMSPWSGQRRRGHSEQRVRDAEHGAHGPGTWGAAFCLVSTDKAVRPTNIMGASKRVAEMILQAIAASSHAPFDTAPFSMALSYPIFHGALWQRAGFQRQRNPAVPPPDRRRRPDHRHAPGRHALFRMTIPEAAQLVLQGTMAEGGDLFLLDMGEPIRIVDLARRIVALAGLTVRDGSTPAATSPSNSPACDPARNCTKNC